LDKKLQKRKNIATSCCETFVKDGFSEISISQIASIANVGKGTIYEYFSNKEDIVFELMNCLQENYANDLKNKLLNITSKKQKLQTIFGIFLENSEIQQTRQEIYKQFIIVLLSKPTQDMLKFNTKLRDNYIKIIDDTINNKVIASKLYDTITGYFISSITLYNYDLKHKINELINTILNKEN